METFGKLWDSPRTIPAIVLVCTLAMWGVIAWLAPGIVWLKSLVIFLAVVQLMIGTMFLGEHIPGHGWLDTEKAWYQDTTLLASPAGIPYFSIKSGGIAFLLLVWLVIRGLQRLRRC